MEASITIPNILIQVIFPPVFQDMSESPKDLFLLFLNTLICSSSPDVLLTRGRLLFNILSLFLLLPFPSLTSHTCTRLCRAFWPIAGRLPPCLTLTPKQNICNFQAFSGFTSCSRYYFCPEHPSPPHRNGHTYVKQLALQDAFSDSPTSYTTSQGWTSSL